MKKLYLMPFIAFLLVATIVSASTLTRNVPTTVNPGQTFTVTYTPSGTPSGNWFVAWEDSVSGGCTPATYQAFLANGGTGSTTFTAPASGSCTFTGFYQFTNENQQNFPSSTVTISSGGTCIPDNSCATNTCIGSTCTNNCGSILQGTKDCSSACVPNSACASTTCIGETCSDGCGGTVQGTKTCSGSTGETWEFCLPAANSWEFLTSLTKSQDCQVNTIALIVGIILLIIAIGALIK